MRITKKGPAIRPTSLHYMAGIFALILACCSLVCIYWYTTTAHASSGSQQTKGMTMSGQAPFDDTETASPTMTITPSPTTTSTPAPSPSATRTTTPSPTSTKAATPTATDQPTLSTPTTTGQQTPSPVTKPTSSATSISITTQGAGVNQTPVTWPAPANTQGNQAIQGASYPDNTLPLSSLTLSLGSVILLGLLCIPGWVILRRRLLPPLSSRFPPSGATPWCRTRPSEQVSPFILRDTTTENLAPLGPSTEVMTDTPGSKPPASWPALPTMADVPIPHQTAPSSGDHATTTATSPALPTRSPTNGGQSLDSPFLAARIKRRRDELRAAVGLSAFQRRGADELSAEIAELNDPYLQSLIQLRNERGQTMGQSPHRRS